MKTVLTKKQWIAILQDPNIKKEKMFELFKCIYKYPKHRMNAGQLAKKMGYSNSAPLNAMQARFGKAIIENGYEVNLDVRDDGRKIYWNIPFIGYGEGIDSELKVQGKFYWTLRPELTDAIAVIIKDDYK